MKKCRVININVMAALKLVCPGALKKSEMTEVNIYLKAKGAASQSASGSVAGDRTTASNRHLPRIASE